MNSLLKVGQVMKKSAVHSDLVKVRTLKMVLDKRLLKYFNEKKDYWAVEDGIKCKVGDVVLIESYQGDERTVPKVTTRIREKVFNLGMVVDPVTGRRCRGRDFIDEEAREKEIQQFYTD